MWLVGRSGHSLEMKHYHRRLTLASSLVQVPNIDRTGCSPLLLHNLLTSFSNTPWRRPQISTVKSNICNRIVTSLRPHCVQGDSLAFEVFIMLRFLAIYEHEFILAHADHSRAIYFEHQALHLLWSAKCAQTGLIQQNRVKSIFWDLRNFNPRFLYQWVR